LLFPGFAVFALTSPLSSGGQSVVPSEDYSHAPPCCAVFFVKGERPKPNRESTKKKTMKTTTDQKTKTGLLSRPEPLSTANPRQIDFKRRRANRSLDTAKLLTLLESDAPMFHEAAEIVGKWVWIEFEDKQPVQITRTLAELGFHWNRLRQAWQHPCGIYRDRRAMNDPRYRYGSYAATDPQNPINATRFATTATQNATNRVVQG
jgi:hypothetical protein